VTTAASKLRAAAVAVAIAGIAAAASGTAAGGARTTSAQSVDLGACPEHVRPKRLRCGRLDLPLERADPSRGTIPITFAVRRPSDRSRPSRGAIFAVEGGPGYGSIGSARYYVHMLGPLLRTRELVLVDMRGTGHSRAIDCPGLQSGRSSDTRGVAQCARLLGRDYGSYRTSAAADDIDDVRRALGLETISLYGDSYGTFLSQSYAFRHGRRLDALVLDSAYPVRGEDPLYPSLWQTGIGGLSIACDRANRCHGDAAARLERMVELLRETPRGVGPLLDAIAYSGYEPPTRSYLEIDAAISEYLAGNRRPYRKLIAPGPGGYGSYRSYSRGDELTVSCNDYPMLWDKNAGPNARRMQLAAHVRRYPPRMFAPFTPREVARDSSAGYLECLAWPKPSRFYEPPAPVNAPRPTMPTLVISGELDDVTSPAEGAAVARDFADARQLIVRNAGHVPSLYGERYPARDAVRRFFATRG
jgi:pimeloyl-ACP methyl ester carboxylesterase